MDVGLVIDSEGVFSDELALVLADAPALALRRTDSADAARRLILAQELQAAIVLGPDFDAQVDLGETADVRILGDSSNPLVAPAVTGLLMNAVIRTASRLGDEVEGGPPLEEPIRITVEDAVGGPDRDASTAYFAAGLGVLFLMLSISNRAGMMLDERDNGTLERMLSTQLSLNAYLFGRGVFLALLGGAQISVMFAWAAIAFGLPLTSHLGGFALMAALSAVAASGFGLFLALLCRTREQLTAASIVVVLILAAIGGNLFPRFLMPDWLEAIGWFTFNAWALDGFQQVFWYDAPLSALGRHVAVLLGATLAFFITARGIAGRWAR
jgi:ABC-2 type transport system permease protein